MKTVVLKSDDPGAVERCAEALRQGELVSFPTETVYGLGADALNAEAVAKIFEAKGRPATNPLISHVASVDQARDLAGAWPEAAQKLAEAFWPGPLTLIVPRGAQVPDAVSAGLDSMGIRMPDHPVALALIRAAGRPVAAPSANRYTEVSPTTAEHVLRGLSGRIAFLLDGGPTDVGIESTVLSLVTETPTILRPGMVGLAEISEVVGRVALKSEALGDEVVRASPGLSRRHYAPTVPLVLSDNLEVEGPFGGRDVVIARAAEVDAPHLVALGDEPANWARELYALLHQYSSDTVDRIVVERPPATPEWAPILDRLERAATEA